MQSAAWGLGLLLVLSGMPPQKPETKPLTNADVVSMVKAGLAESTILLAIQRGPTDFDTSPQALVSLKSEGVTQKVFVSHADCGYRNRGGSKAEPAIRRQAARR